MPFILLVFNKRDILPLSLKNTNLLYYADKLGIKYIDKIIFEWTKNGIKTVDDLEKQEKSKQESEPVDLDIGDWNWLDDEEEYIGN